jgi:hypothetical protein
MDDNNNRSELMNFLQTNQERTLGGKVLKQYAFTASVAYCHAARTTTFETEVRVETSGYDDGKISLTETDKCPVEKFHLDFKPEWNTMHFNRESNILEINGNSKSDNLKKMGLYKVSIRALAPVGL